MVARPDAAAAESEQTHRRQPDHWIHPAWQHPGDRPVSEPARQSAQPDWRPGEPDWRPGEPDWRQEPGWDNPGPDREPDLPGWRGGGPHWGPSGPGWADGGPQAEPGGYGWAGGGPQAEPGGYGWADGGRQPEPAGYGGELYAEASGYGGDLYREPDDDAGTRWQPSDRGTAPGVAQDAAPQDRAEPSDRGPVPRNHEDVPWAILSYMSAAIFGFGPPLVIYLIKMRRSPFVRAHAVQAVNTAATTFLYTVCLGIVGGLLALDSVTFAVLTAGGAAVLLWLVALAYLVRATIAASGGTFYRIPGWLCATLLRR